MSELENVAEGTELLSAEIEKTATRLQNPAQTLDQSLAKLVKVGGFDFLENCIDGLRNLNPSSKARKKIFLAESDKAAERADLRKKLDLWMELLTGTGTIADMLETCDKKAESATNLLNQNLKTALDATHNLEQAYRSVHLFYKNTESDKVRNVTIVNAAMEDLKDLDNPRYIDYIAEELKQNYDRLDLRDNYGLLVIPGYLGSNKVVERWAKIAHENKVTLFTDFMHLDKPDDVLDMFATANLTGGDAYRSNVVMTCNWLVGRGKVNEVGEEEDLFVPPSAALAGKVYGTLMSQVTAGNKHGRINEVDAVSFDLKKSELAQLEKAGLVPMVNEYGMVMAYSAKTLFNGDNLGLQTYSVVRVFDYIAKVLIDFLNRRAFENWTGKTEQDLRNQIVKFLDSIKGPNKLIEKFTILHFDRDAKVKDKVNIDIHITPYFPAKNFVVRLDGTKGEEADAAKWNSEYNQQ